MTDHPLRAALATWLPESDFSVLGHRFAEHGRDYLLIIQVAGTGIYELTLTHVVEQHYETNVGVDVWPRSWDDILTDYKLWKASSPLADGYVWGTNSSLAYPGIELPGGEDAALKWSNALGKPMFAVDLTTDRFKLRLIFHGARWRKTSANDAAIASILNPLSPLG